MSETQPFICPGRYFGRYCSDEREYEYARILERGNREILEGPDLIKSPEESEACIEAKKLSEDFSNFLKKLKEQGLID